MQHQPTLPPAPPAPAVVMRPGAVSPVSVYEAYTAQRDELGQQLENLQDTRHGIAEKLQDPMVRGSDRSGLEARMTSLDARIAGLDKQIASADAQVAQSAAVPGAVAGHEQRISQMRNDGPSDGPFVLGGIFIVVVLLPISIAYARRIWRRGSTVVAAIPGELMERISRLDQAVDSIAVEVERIGEGQRFMTKQFADANSGRSLGAGAMEPVRQPEREKAGY